MVAHLEVDMTIRKQSDWRSQVETWNRLLETNSTTRALKKHRKMTKNIKSIWKIINSMLESSFRTGPRKRGLNSTSKKYRQWKTIESNKSWRLRSHSLKDQARLETSSLRITLTSSCISRMRWATLTKTTNSKISIKNSS